MKKFQLTSQIIRCPRSMMTNIAEGYGRYIYSDTRNFFIMARGSVTEAMEHLQTAFDEKYISDIVLKNYEEKCESIFKLINGYIAYLDKSKKQSTNQSNAPKS